MYELQMHAIVLQKMKQTKKKVVDKSPCVPSIDKNSFFYKGATKEIFIVY